MTSAVDYCRQHLASLVGSINDWIPRAHVKDHGHGRPHTVPASIIVPFTWNYRPGEGDYTRFEAYLESDSQKDTYHSFLINAELGSLNTLDWNSLACSISESIHL